jgi:hypothetical protein
VLVPSTNNHSSSALSQRRDVFFQYGVMVETRVSMMVAKLILALKVAMAGSSRIPRANCPAVLVEHEGTYKICQWLGRQRQNISPKWASLEFRRSGSRRTEFAPPAAGILA